MHEYGIGIVGKDCDDNKAIKYYQKVCCDTDTTIDIDKIWQIWKNPSTDNANKNHCKEAMKYLKILIVWAVLMLYVKWGIYTN